MTTRNIPLGDIVDIKGGKRLPKDTAFSSTTTNHPYIRVVDFKNHTIDRSKLKYISDSVQKEIAKYTISKKDVYISIAGTIGEVGIIPEELDGANLTENAAKLKIRNEDRLDKKFLVYALTSNQGQTQIRKESFSVGVPKLALERIRTIKIPLPPLAEQKRIAAILDKANELKEKRKQAIRKLDELVQAVFLDMFGDIWTNSRNWPTRRLGDLIKLDAPMVDPRKEEFQDLLHIGPDRIEKNSGGFFPAHTAREDRLISGKFLFDEHDVLYSKIRPYLRKVALPSFKGLCSADMYPVRPIDKMLTREYLWVILVSEAFVKYTEGLASRASIPKINRTELCAYEIMVPPFDLQNKFTKTFNILLQKKRQLLHSQKQIELLQAAFSNDLLG